MEVVVHQNDRAAWHAARSQRFGASEIARLLCEAPAKSEEERLSQRARLLAEKSGMSPQFEGNETTRLATLLEVPVIDIARDVLRLDIAECGVWTRSERYARLGCTPDAYITIGGARCPCNIKVTSSQATEDCRAKKNGEPSGAAFAGGLPMYYRIQAIAEAMVTEANHAFMLVLHTSAGLKLRLYSQPIHVGLAERIARETLSAWADVERMREGMSAA